MESVEATIVFLPRFTTLVGPGTFRTLPLDVSKYSGAQFQLWVGPLSAGSFTVYLEESLDAENWVLGPSTPEGIALTSNQTRFFSYGFRLRWFRLKVVMAGGSGGTLVTCWAEGLLRGGGGGVWALPKSAAPQATGPTTGAAETGAAARGTGESVMPPQPATPRDWTKGGSPLHMPGYLPSVQGLTPQELMALAADKLGQAGKK